MHFSEVLFRFFIFILLYILQCCLTSFPQRDFHWYHFNNVHFLIETFHIIAMHRIAHTAHTLHITYYYYIVHTDVTDAYLFMNVVFCIDLMTQ